MQEAPLQQDKVIPRSLLYGKNEPFAIDVRLRTIWSPSGIPAFDIAMSGELGKGLPWGYVLEIIGDEKAGKSSLMLLFGKQILYHDKQKGIFFLLEPEGTLKTDRVAALGITPEDMRITEFDLLERAFDFMEDRIDDLELLRLGYPYKEGDKTKQYPPDMETPMIIGLDTLNAESFEGEFTKDQGKGDTRNLGKLTSRFFARAARKIMRSQVILIFVTQKRIATDAYGNIIEISPTKALQYYGSCKLKMSRIWHKVNRDGVAKSKYITSQIFIDNSKVGPSEMSLWVDIQQLPEGDRKPGVQPISSVYWSLKKLSKKIVDRVPKGMKLAKEHYILPDGTAKLIDNREKVEQLWEDERIREAMIADLQEIYR